MSQVTHYHHLLPAGYETTRKSIAIGRLQVDLFLVADPNQLCDRVDTASFDVDERFPYWAELWPSAVALARFLARRGVPRGGPALELGCGTGLVGVTAALLGARVVFTDFEADALAFAGANHALNLGRAGQTRHLDWRHVPPGLTAPLVLAADVLYEERFLEPFLGAVRSLLAPGGTALVAEPGRRIAEGSIEQLEAEGFQRHLHLEEGTLAQRPYAVWIHEICKPGPPAGTAVPLFRCRDDEGSP